MSPPDSHGLARLIATLVVVLGVALPTAAQAAKSPASATISACKGDHMTVAGKVAVTGKAAGKVRGANLQLRFQALPLFGLPRASDWRDLGKKKKGSGSQDFTGLGFDNWVGVLSWRFKKGSRTVMSGDERSQPVRIGGAKGQANCTLAEGLKPIDKTPPTIFITPADDSWHHAPAGMQVSATDDFSGVQGMRYSVDDGPITPVANGGTISIAAEGAHKVDVAATDVAGNTAVRTVTFRVDAGPPTKPVLSRPFSVTASQTPTFAWSASTDSGSGLRGYFLAIKRPDGSVVSLQPLDANTTSAQSATTLDDGQTYTAVVTAVDNTADQAWAIDSDPLTFKVDTHPDVSSPQDGQVLAFDAKKQPVVVNFDRPLDKSTVNGVTLTRDSSTPPSGTGVLAPQCGSPCTSVTLTPSDQSNGLPEGRYTLHVDVKSEEGTPIQGTFHFAVPNPANEVAAPPSTNLACPLGATQSFTINTTAGNETGQVSFVYSITAGTGQVSVSVDGGAATNSAPLTSPGNGTRQTISVIMATAGSHALSMKYCIASGNGTLSLSNVWASRVPPS